MRASIPHNWLSRWAAQGASSWKWCCSFFLYRQSHQQVTLPHSSSTANMYLCLVVQSCPTVCDPMDCSLPGSSVHGDSPGKNAGAGCHALLQGIFPTRDWTQVSCTAGNSLPSEPPGKPKDVPRLQELQCSLAWCPHRGIKSLTLRILNLSKDHIIEPEDL